MDKTIKKLIVVPDNKTDKFTKSECKCSFCVTTQSSTDEWDNLPVKTNLQKRMKEVISEIEKRANKL